MPGSGGLKQQSLHGMTVAPGSRWIPKSWRTGSTQSAGQAGRRCGRVKPVASRITRAPQQGITPLHMGQRTPHCLPQPELAWMIGMMIRTGKSFMALE